MKATDLLEKQHRKVEAIFKKLESGRSSARELVLELANNLAAHMAIEQEIFYPAAASVDAKTVSESLEEHSLAEVAVKRLAATDPRDGAFMARVTAAKELIAHHLEEEENELFPKVEKALGAARLEEMGKKMKQRFDEVLAAGFARVVPKTFNRTSADVARGRVRQLRGPKATTRRRVGGARAGARGARSRAAAAR